MYFFFYSKKKSFINFLTSVKNNNIKCKNIMVIGDCQANKKCIIRKLFESETKVEK